MSVFSHKRDEKSGSENIQWEENPLYQEEKVNDAASKSTMEELYGELGTSKKGGLFKNNSDYYNAVSSCLSNVVTLMSHPLKGDMEQLEEEKKLLSAAYVQLIEACQRYCARRSFTGNGKARQALVKRIQEQAESDIDALGSYFGRYLLLPESERAEDVRQALEVARRKRLEMKEADSEHEHVGGAASRLTVLKQGDLKASDESGYFKEQDIFTYHNSYKTAILEIMEKCHKKYRISDSLYEEARDVVADESVREDTELIVKNLLNMEEATEDLEFIKFIRQVETEISAWLTKSNHICGKMGLNIKLKEGESINMSNRNVATSMVADLLGIGDVVAKSETVELMEPGQKKGRVGNLMQKAQGREAVGIQEDYIKKAYAQNASENPTQLTQKVTGKFQKQLTNLQVLDYITGQIDRHGGNYLVQEDEATGQLTGVTGIDNDFSFGDYNMNSGSGSVFLNGRSVINKNGELLIPHMDKELAQRIKSIDAEQLKFMLAHLLDEQSIERACDRLKRLQDAIKAVKEDSGVFLDDDEWNADTLEHFRNKKALDNNVSSVNASYLGEFLNAEKKSIIENRGWKLGRLDKWKTIWERERRPGGKLDTPDKINEILSMCLTAASEIISFRDAKLRGALSPDVAFEELPATLKASLQAHDLPRSLVM